MDDYDLFADLYAVQNHSVPEQAYTPHDNPSVLEAPTSGTLPIVPQLASTQNYIPQLFNLSLTSYSDQPHNAQPLSDSQRVKDTIEAEFGFQAEVRQYRTRISQWGRDKNIKPHEMKAVVRKRQRRKLIESQKGELTFTVRGNEVEPQKIDRWMKRNEIPEDLVYAPSPAASTPSAVGCWTIPERGSPAPSLTYSVGSPAFQMRGASVAQSPGPFSPALSITSVLRPSASTFTGQSPAPVHQVLPDLRQGPMPAPETLPYQSVSLQPYTVGHTPQTQTRQADTESVRYPYRQTDEDRLRQELSALEIRHGDDHPETLSTLFNLSKVLMDQGRYGSAGEMIRRVVEARQKVNGNDDKGTVEALNLLGDLLYIQGSYAKAESLHRQAFESSRRILGHEHPSTLISMSNLALTYQAEGRLKEAEELGVQVVETRKRVLGHEHPNTLISMANLTSIYYEQGRLKEAEELEVQVIETRKRVLGHEHPSTPISTSNLALTYRVQGRPKEAKELKVQVVETMKRVLGHEHPDTLISMGNLAFTYRIQGRLKEAEELGVQVVETMKRVLGHEHPDTLKSMDCLASIYRAQGRLNKDEELGVQVIETMVRVLGYERPYMLTTTVSPVDAYYEPRQVEEPEELEL